MKHVSYVKIESSLFKANTIAALYHILSEAAAWLMFNIVLIRWFHESQIYESWFFFLLKNKMNIAIDIYNNKNR